MVIKVYSKYIVLNESVRINPFYSTYICSLFSVGRCLDTITISNSNNGVGTKLLHKQISSQNLGQAKVEQKHE